MGYGALVAKVAGFVKKGKDSGGKDSGGKDSEMVGKIGAGALAGVQALKARKAEKEADALLPSPIGVYDQRMYTNLQREVQSRKNQALGQRGAALRQAMASGSRNMFKTGGPIDYGVITSMGSTLARNMQEQSGNETLAYTQMLQQQGEKMQDTINDLGLLRSGRKDLKAAGLRQSANRNTGALLGLNSPVGNGQSA
jgi:hypothetical protein